MNKVIPIWVLVGGFVLVGGALGFILVPGFVQEKPIEKILSPQTEIPQDGDFLFQETPKTPIFGIYEVCSEIEGCNPETGIEKIKASGAEAVIVTVVDEENLKSVTYYPSKYLSIAEDTPNDYLKRIVAAAHHNNIKVYASINMPHNYLLAKHPDWIAVLSNGKRADAYEKDYFHRIVPPSRVIAEKEYRDLLKNIIDEVIGYNVDGIDINDNFQFSDQYLKQTDTTLYSSFDDFTMEKFGKDTNIVVQGNFPEEKAGYIQNHPDVYKSWLRWRADEIIQLFRILKQNIKSAGVDIPLRPHLLTHKDPYEYYGLDYEGIAKEVDVLYMMITPDQPKEKYFEVIKNSQGFLAEKIVSSTYLLKDIDNPVVERDEEKILERMRWMAEAGSEEIYVYNFNLIEHGNLWAVIESIFGRLRIIVD